MLFLTFTAKIHKNFIRLFFVSSLLILNPHKQKKILKLPLANLYHSCLGSSNSTQNLVILANHFCSFQHCFNFFYSCEVTKYLSLCTKSAPYSILNSQTHNMAVNILRFRNLRHFIQMSTVWLHLHRTILFSSPCR